MRVNGSDNTAAGLESHRHAHTGPQTHCAGQRYYINPQLRTAKTDTPIKQQRGDIVVLQHLRQTFSLSVTNHNHFSILSQSLIITMETRSTNLDTAGSQ